MNSTRPWSSQLFSKISGVTRRDPVRNLDILKDKDIVNILQIRRLTYFVHVTPWRYPHISVHGYIHMDSVQEEDHRRSGWTICVKIVQRWTYPLFKHHVLPGTGLNGGARFARRAANAWRLHRRLRIQVVYQGFCKFYRRSKKLIIFINIELAWIILVSSVTNYNYLVTHMRILL